MRLLRHLMCCFGVLAGALVFSSSAMAKPHAGAQKAVVPQHRSGASAARRAAPANRPVANKTRDKHLARAVNRKERARFVPRVVEEPDFDHAGNPMLRSSAFYVQDIRTGEVLLEKNASSVLPIASITKLMTAMVVLDAHLPLNEMLEISEEDVDRIKGTSSHLTVGTPMTRENLMRLALMSSENRAAASLARNYPGGMRAFVEAMNGKAQLLGMSDTRFYDSSGLNHGNVSSARDLATLVSTASHYPLIREFTTTAEHTVELAGGRPRTFHNTNALVKSPEWQIEVSKTGFINESGKCLVMQAWMANKPLAIVLLDSWGRFTRLADANRIRRWLETVLPRNAKVAGTAPETHVMN